MYVEKIQSNQLHISELAKCCLYYVQKSNHGEVIVIIYALRHILNALINNSAAVETAGFRMPRATCGTQCKQPPKHCSASSPEEAARVAHKQQLITSDLKENLGKSIRSSHPTYSSTHHQAQTPPI